MFHLEEHEAKEKFNDWLDVSADNEDGIEVLGSYYSVSEILKNCDPIKYGVLFADYVDIMAEEKEFTTEGFHDKPESVCEECGAYDPMGDEQQWHSNNCQTFNNETGETK